PPRPRRFRWQSPSKTAYPARPPTARSCPAASGRIAPRAWHRPLYLFPGNPSRGSPPNPRRRSRPTRPPPVRFAPPGKKAVESHAPCRPRSPARCRYSPPSPAHTPPPESSPPATTARPTLANSPATPVAPRSPTVARAGPRRRSPPCVCPKNSAPGTSVRLSARRPADQQVHLRAYVGAYAGFAEVDGHHLAIRLAPEHALFHRLHFVVQLRRTGRTLAEHFRLVQCQDFRTPPVAPARGVAHPLPAAQGKHIGQGKLGNLGFVVEGIRLLRGRAQAGRQYQQRDSFQHVQDCNAATVRWGRSRVRRPAWRDFRG